MINDPGAVQTDPTISTTAATMAQSTPFWTSQNIQHITGGAWLNKPSSDTLALSAFSIDSRAIKAGEVFIAICGTRFNGHDYLSQAIDRGASLLVVSDQAAARQIHASGIGIGILWVSNTLKALQDLASAYRQCLHDRGTCVIAVTGSNGKTTTRHLIHSVLSAKWQGCQSHKNFNNHIGVPLTLLSVGVSDRFVVVELGSSSPGEIARLAELVRPDVAVITNIAMAHLAAFGDKKAIAAEKAAILAHVSNKGLAVVPSDEPLLIPYLKQAQNRGINVLCFGQSPESDLRLDHCAQHDQSMVFSTTKRSLTQQERVVDFRLPMLGRHNAINALAAIFIARKMGVDDQEIAKALNQVVGIAMRLDVSHVGRSPHGVVLINDAYNASPESMWTAIETLASHPLPNPARGGRRVLVLGDMLELGSDEKEAHFRLGHQIVKLATGIDKVILAGRLSAFTAQPLEANWSSDRYDVFDSWNETACQQTASMLKSGDVVLIKASRSVGLERLVPHIEAAGF